MHSYDSEGVSSSMVGSRSLVMIDRREVFPCSVY